MDITTWIAFGGLALTTLTPIFALAFQLGKQTERLATLERKGEGQGSLAIAFAEFRGEVKALLASQDANMQGLRADLTWLRQSALYEPEALRRRSEP